MSDSEDVSVPSCPDGSLVIIKYGRIWKSFNKLKMVTCVSAGNLCYQAKPLIVALCADSDCFIFDVSTSSPDDSCLQPSHHQMLAHNAKDVRIIDGSGPCDMVVAYSDRVVRLYRWKQSPTSSEDFKGELVLLLKWELAGQITRIGVHSTPSQPNLIIASQPGGGFAYLQKKFETYQNKMCPTLVYHPPKLTSTGNVETRTWVVGNIGRHRTQLPPTATTGDNETAEILVRADKQGNYMALCLADGTVVLLDSDLEKNEVIWCAQLQVHGELFGLSKLHLTSEETEDVSVCCWDGSTYIFNHCKDILRFLLGQACQAFTSGKFAVTPGNNQSVLIYVTCERSILIYYNLNVDTISPYALTHKLFQRPQLMQKLAAHGVDTSDPAHLAQAIRFLLYDYSRLDQLSLNVSSTDDTTP